MKSGDSPVLPEDKRLTACRNKVELDNLVEGLKVCCGLLGLFALFILCIGALVEGTEGGLLAGGILRVVSRFGKTAFWLACFWGLLQPWIDYAERQQQENKRRNEMLARMEQDPLWFTDCESK